MEFSEFAFRVILLFLPGLICGTVVDELTIHRPRKPFGVLLRALIFGFAAYFLSWLILWTCHGWRGLPQELTFLRALQDKQVKLSLREIAAVCGIAVVLGLVMSIVTTYRLIPRLGRRCKISKKSGEIDIWGYAMNLPRVEFVAVRDHKRNLMYEGWVEGFSDDGEKRELFLRDVEVKTNDEGELIYNVGAIYLSLKVEDHIAVEFRDVGFTPEYEQVLADRNQNHEQETSVAAESTTGASGSVGGDGQEGRRQPAAHEHSTPSRPGPEVALGSQEEVADSAERSGQEEPYNY